VISVDKVETPSERRILKQNLCKDKTGNLNKQIFNKIVFFNILICGRGYTKGKERKAFESALHASRWCINHFVVCQPPLKPEKKRTRQTLVIEHRAPFM